MDGNSEKTIDLFCLPLLMTHAAAGTITRSFQSAQRGFLPGTGKNWNSTPVWLLNNVVFWVFFRIFAHFVFVKEELTSNLSELDKVDKQNFRLCALCSTIWAVILKT